MFPDTCATCSATIGPRDRAACFDTSGNCYCDRQCRAQAERDQAARRRWRELAPAAGLELVGADD